MRVIQIPNFQIKFEPRDLWIGAYWNVEKKKLDRRELKIFLCIVPTFPIIFTLRWWDK